LPPAPARATGTHPASQRAPGRPPRLRRALTLAAVAGLLAAGCSSPATSAHSSSSGGTLTVGLAEAPDALDPTTSGTFVSRIVYANMCEKLYDVNAQLSIVPQLAAALPQVSGNGLTYTIRLRPGVKFNDGTPLTAAAVKTTLDWYRTDPVSNRASELTQLKSVQVTGPLTVQLNLSAPFAPLTSILADRSGMILSPAQLHKLGKNFASDPVCVGPFAFASRPSTDTINLVKSKYYYGKTGVHLSRLVFQVITDQSARAADLQSGDIQVADRIAPQDVSTIRKNSATRITGQNSLGYQGLDFNVGNVHGSLQAPGTAANPFAGHPQLREAFGLTINRAELNKAAFDGQYTPGCTPIPPGSPWAVHVPCPQQNIARARQLVAASGVKTPIHVSLMVENAPQQIQIGTVLQTMAKAAGFDVALQPTEFTAALSKAAAGQYELFQIGWSGRIDPDQNIYPEWYPRSGLNYTGADYPAVDQLLTQARTTLRVPARHVLYTRIVQLLQQERNVIYLWYDKLELGLRRNVTGVAFYPDGLIRLKNAQVGSG
jgi:peptide/nickel transport system substrate-binding protein